MTIRNQDELTGMRAAGAVVHQMLEAMKQAVKQGVTTAELDEVGDRVMRKHGARSGPSLVYDFPGVSCISVNDEVVHGIPRTRKLQDGDLVKLDVTIELNGFMADAAITVPVGAVSEEKQRLVSCVRMAFESAVQVARAGVRVSEIGRAVEKEVNRSGFSVVRELGGHGIGRTIHEEPSVPNFPDPSAHQVLTKGLVITIEPIIAAGSGKSFTAKDGWTIQTSDGTPSAHYEHTLVITQKEPEILTA
jgi:methionyl aminopeptidase